MGDQVSTSGEDGWLRDADGNRCSIAHFGTREAAQAALDSLDDCRDCINCSRCSDCSDCSHCSGCSGCSGCSDCSGCSGCSRCSGCSHCSDCSHCSRCSGCSHIANLYGREGLKADPSSPEMAGRPPVPVIENIHARVLEAASKPGALDMSRWHTCGTTHCRAGWAVHLAGEAGYALERWHNTALAAQLIYDASDPSEPFNPCRFYDSDSVALADMRARAEREAA